jgi:hypothetical protein
MRIPYHNILIRITLKNKLKKMKKREKSLEFFISVP